MKKKNILVGCEESQAVVIELRKLGYNAFSCDIEFCSGGHPEWHVVIDLIKLIELKGNFQTQDGKLHSIDTWDGLIAFPPCTYMSKAGARWMYPKAGIISADRLEKAVKAKNFFMALWNSDIENISLENPQPLKVVGLPIPTQTIHPYMFGHPYSKRTNLWLKGFPKLIPTNILTEYKPYLPSNTGGAKRGQKFMYKSISQKDSSKTFPGIALAMANQWHNHLQKT